MICEQYEERFTGEYFANFIRDYFNEAFANSANANANGKLFLQDGDPRQNSALAKKAMDDINARMFAIPPRSPDINPIENFFHLLQLKLNRDAMDKNITKETFREFSARIKETMMNFPVEGINHLIESMDKRMCQIIKSKGGRLKY